MSNTTERSGKDKCKVIDFRTRLELGKSAYLDAPTEIRSREAVELSDEVSPKEVVAAMDLGKTRQIHPVLDFLDGKLFMAVVTAFLDPKSGEMGYVPSVLTSAGEQFFMSAAEFAKRGFFSKVAPEDVFLEPRISGAVVRSFVENGRRGDLLGTFERVRDQLRACIELEEQSAYAYLAAWTLGTYMFPVFRAYPYIHFNGPKGVGKTTALEVLSSLCFNGEMSPSVSASAQFRLTHYSRATLLLDEAENLQRRAYSETKAVLLAGYRNGQSVLRSEGNGRGRRPIRYEVYSPRAMASQRGFEDALASRTVKVQMRRASRSVLRLDDSAAMSIRDNCFLAALTSALDVHDIYVATENPAGVLPCSDREYELFHPMLAIATATGDPGVVEDVTRFAIASHERQLAEFAESSIEHAFLVYLLEAVQRDGQYRGDALLAGFGRFVSDNDVELSKALTAKSQGELLASLGLVDRAKKKRSSDNRTRLYVLERKGIEEAARSYGLVPTS